MCPEVERKVAGGGITEEDMIYYVWRVPFFLNLASFFFLLLNIPYMTFLDLLLLPLSHSDCIIECLLKRPVQN